MSIVKAQKALEAKCREEFDMHVITRIVGETLYVFYPTDKPMFDYEAQKKSSATQPEPKNKFAVEFVDGNFKDNAFHVEYDIVAKKKSSKEDPGYSSTYTDTYSKDQNNLFIAISDTLFNSKAEKDETMPQFAVMVVTDIKKGLEVRSTFYLEDFKRFMTGDLPYEEYMKRFLSEVKGGQNLIGDETGSHIEYKNIIMPDFLSQQIVNRINFKFQRSDFPPNPDFDDAIIGIVADTTRYYGFIDFTEVKLNNLRQDKKFIFSKLQLASFGDDKLPNNNKGKLIHIIFENGKAKFNE